MKFFSGVPGYPPCSPLNEVAGQKSPPMTAYYPPFSHYMAITSTHASYPSVPYTLALPYALYHPKSYRTLDHLNPSVPWTTLGASLAWMTLDHTKPIRI